MKRKLALVTLTTLMLAGCAGGTTENSVDNKQLSFIGSEVASSD